MSWTDHCMRSSLALLSVLVSATALACPGDCDDSGRLTAADLTRMVAIALLCEGTPAGCAAVPRSCPNGDFNGNGRIDVGDLIAAINQILTYSSGCPPTPPPVETATPSPTPTATSTLSPSPTSTVSPTPTTSPSPTSLSLTPTYTVVPSPTPSPTAIAAICGNGVVEPPETCDDGNTITQPPTDSCPEDCTILTCSPSPSRVEVAVTFSSPRGLASIAVLVEYPDGNVQLPGTGDDSSVAARVVNRPSGFLATIFDFDYAVRVGLAGTRALTGSQLFRIQFDLCRDTSPPPVTAYRCRVVEANDTNFQPVTGVTCSVTIP